MSGHGHVYPNADGSKARCGGPGICQVCSREHAQATLDGSLPAIDVDAVRRHLHTIETLARLGEELKARGGFQCKIVGTDKAPALQVTLTPEK